MSNEKIEVSKAELTELLRQNEELKQDVKKLYDGSIKTMELLGLAKDGRFKSEYFGPDSDSPIGEIVKEAGSLMVLVTQASMPVIGKKAEKKLMDKFGFFVPLIPVFEKYGKQFNGK